MIIDGLVASIAVVGAAMVALWLISLLIKDVSIVDIFWGLGFVAVAWTIFILSGSRGTRAYALLAITTAWGVRLALYLSWRNWGKGEDFRYKAMREARADSFWWQSAYSVFGFQGILIVLVSLPLLVGIGLYGDRGISALGLAGLAVVAIGLFFEWLGDWQLLRFKANPDNRGKIMKRGLWSWTRHPNYFGDFMVWWGLTAIASPAPARAWVVIGPIIMSLMLLKVSGVGLLEKTMRTRPGYGDYIARTSAFFPRPPR